MSLKHIEDSTRVQIIGLLLICGMTFFFNIGQLRPSIMEARNFITAKEMLTNHNWLIPTLNGELRLAKPPLPTWITALTGLLVSDINNETALRIPAAGMALFMIFSLYGLTKVLTKDKFVPFLAAAILSTSFYAVLMARQGTWDIYCHAFMLGAIWALASGLKKPNSAYKEFATAGIFMGLSFMSKGPVSFYALLGPFLIAYLIAFGGDLIKKKWRELLLAGFTCLIISAWWPIYTYMNVPNDLILNVNTEITSWQERHVRPFWHYWNFPVQSGIWALFITISLIIPYAKPRVEKARGKYQFLFWWVISTIILLSLIPEKKERYLMPGLISQALLASFYLKYLIDVFRANRQTVGDRLVLNFHSILLALVCIGIPVGLVVYGHHSIGKTPAFWVFTTILLGLGVVFLVQFKKQQVILVFLALALVAGVASAFGPYFFKLNQNKLSLKHLARINDSGSWRIFNCYSLTTLRPEELWDIGSVVTTLNGFDKLPALEDDSVVVFISVPADQVESELEKNQCRTNRTVGVFQHPTTENQAWIVSITTPKRLHEIFERRYNFPSSNRTR